MFFDYLIEKFTQNIPGRKVGQIKLRKMRKTKIVCTLGPASSSPKVLREMITAGMDVARLNFSHGTKKEHIEKIKRVREISASVKKAVALLIDLQGPRVRLGKIANGKVTLRNGQNFVLTSRPIMGSSEIASVTSKQLPKDVKEGDSVFINEGAIHLRVASVKGTEIYTQVIVGGVISDHKGINLPDTTLSTPSITKKDLEDIKFGLSSDVDYIGLSFVRSPDDVARVKKFIRKAGKDTPVIAKIEKHEALAMLDEIISEADGVMVARGDLGVELPLEKVPEHQKNIIRKCARKMKPVITATQMLESMVNSSRPTRAEVSDVANAILDGTDALMLSAETSVGKYPVEAVRTMAKIAVNTEEMLGANILRDVDEDIVSVSESVAQSACFLAEKVNAKLIIAFTESGFTGRLISKFRPTKPVVGVSPHERVFRRMALYWGVKPALGTPVKFVDHMIENAVNYAKKAGLLKKGDKAVITAGVPLAVSGATNLIKVHTV